MSLTLWQVGLLLATALSLGAGQVLFKLAATSLQPGGGLLDIAASAVNPYMGVALVVYGLATGLWVYVLRDLPLSVAYPFVALSFAVVPVLGWLLLGETLSARYFVGLCLIVAGIGVMTAGR